LKEIPLILLLDGLDEVKESDRKSCLEAIGFYGAEAHKNL
jgi:predicted NACHT family NTPase